MQKDGGSAVKEMGLRSKRWVCVSMDPMHLKRASARDIEHLTAKIVFFLQHDYGKDTTDNHSIDTDD